MADIHEIATTIAELIKPQTDARELFKSVRSRHPEASKGEITRAALYAMIEIAERDPAVARELHSFAIERRGRDDR